MVVKYTYVTSHHSNGHLPLFPASPFHNLVLLQVFSLPHCHQGRSNAFLPDNLPVKGGGGEVLHMETQMSTCMNMISSLSLLSD